MIKNPIFPYEGGDPFVLKDGNDYYLSMTEHRPGFHGFRMFHSTDLENWDEPVEIFDLQQDTTWAKDRAWAPAMLKHNGYYYLAFSAEQQIGIAVCDTPMGRYRDLMGGPLVSYYQYGFQTIDPCLFEDDDGKVYMFFGEGKCYLYELELTPTSCKIIGDPVDISEFLYRQVSHQYSVEGYEYFDTSIYNEAPDIIKIGNRYLFSWSIYDVLDYRYAVRYGWSDKITGPYLMPLDYEHDNILLQGHHDITGCGHACITEKDGEYYIFYGRHKKEDRSRGVFTREMCCEKIQFLDENHIVAIPTRSE